MHKFSWHLLAGVLGRLSHSRNTRNHDTVIPLAGLSPPKEGKGMSAGRGRSAGRNALPLFRL